MNFPWGVCSLCKSLSCLKYTVDTSLFGYNLLYLQLHYYYTIKRVWTNNIFYCLSKLPWYKFFHRMHKIVAGPKAWVIFCPKARVYCPLERIKKSNYNPGQQALLSFRKMFLVRDKKIQLVDFLWERGTLLTLRLFLDTSDFYYSSFFSSNKSFCLLLSPNLQIHQEMMVPTYICCTFL